MDRKCLNANKLSSYVLEHFIAAVLQTICCTRYHIRFLFLCLLPFTVCIANLIITVDCTISVFHYFIMPVLENLRSNTVSTNLMQAIMHGLLAAIEDCLCVMENVGNLRRSVDSFSLCNMYCKCLFSFVAIVS